MSTKAAVKAENVLGGIIFILYIVSALVLLCWLLIRLWKATVRSLPLSGPRQTRRIWCFSSLAALSFATLSYHMLNVLISSYIFWAQIYGYSLPQEGSWRGFHALRLWEWAKTSTLFQDFAVSVCTTSNGNWWWTAHVLIFTMAWNIFMAVEGSARGTQSLWLYFALDQILPLSLTMNLFFLSALVEPPHELVSTSKPFQSRLKPSYQVAFLWLYFACLLSAPYTVGTRLLIPLVLVIRILLFFPYVGFRVNPTPESREVKEITNQVQNLWSASKLSMLNTIIGSGLIWLSLVGGITIRWGSWSSLIALFNDPAIGALGFDFLLAIVGAVSWIFMSDGNSNLNE